MYDKEYAQAWIKNHESRKDDFRIKYLEPYFKKTFRNIEKNSTLLDIGCGWGSLLDFLPKEVLYCGIDPTTDFFDYIKKKFPNKNITLKYGKLPNQIEAKNNFYDICVCSQVLHTTTNLEKSIKTLFSKLKTKGKLFIITFNNKSEKLLIPSFNKIEKLDNKHITGEITLDSKIKVHAEIYFHKEKDYEKEILKYGSFIKKKLGPFFTVYECVKNDYPRIALKLS